MMKRQHVSSGTLWEDIVGYSRAVRVGNMVRVAGTTAHDGTQVVAVGDPYEQTIFILQKIARALEEVGASMNDVVATRIYVRDITHWEEIGKAHGVFFRKVRPAATMVEVSRLVEDDLLVEIEVEAVIDDWVFDDWRTGRGIF